MLYKSWKAFIKLFNDYFLIVSEAKHKAKHGKGFQTLTPKQMIQRLLIKTGNISENLLNEIRQVIYSLYRAKKTTKKLYNNIRNSI